MNARAEIKPAGIGHNGGPQFAWSPQPGPQAEAISLRWVAELFYGGAAGGGKSDFLLGDFLQDVPTYGKAWRGIIFRRTYPELEELLARAREIYPQTGAKWNELRRTWTWPNGATLKMRYLARDKDALRYQGHQYTWIGWDELTQWPTLWAYRYLRGRLRSAHDVPLKRIRAAGNPGGPGHLEVKTYFIDPFPLGEELITDPETGIERMFIPSRLVDNQILVDADPTYRARLQALGGNLARAMLGGDWNIIEGAFFENWSGERNVCLPFTIPPDWTRFRSLDWGSARPFSVGWWAIAGDDFKATTPGGRVHLVRRGALVRYREWYGSNGTPNVGLKLTAEKVAEGVLERERGGGDKIAYSVADPAIFSSDGGPSIAERFAKSKVWWKRADNARVAQAGAMGGWDQMRSRIWGDVELNDEGRLVHDGGPGLVVFSTCSDFLRTVPVLQHDPNRAEDVDTDGEDHAGDEARYACMSRPYVKPKPVKPVIVVKSLSEITFEEMLERQKRRDAARR